MSKTLKHVFIILISCSLLISCRTYYQRNIDFNNCFEKGEYKFAEENLSKDKKAEKRKTRLLYYMNMGVVTSLQGKYGESNDYFEKAYIVIEDYLNKPLDIAASFLTNPNMIEYKGEDFERLLIHYYKALNYLKLNNSEAALVECRRMDIKLQQLKDKYKSDKRYKRDAFMHLLMGIIYDSNVDYNNAFIAYRNAYEIYKEDYIKMFGTAIPKQLKEDILRTAYLNGFLNDLDFYEKEFGQKYVHEKENDGNLVFFWHNGLGPVKEEWGIDFVIIRGQAGVVSFRNDDLALNFSFPMSDDEYNSKGLADLEFIRVAFPKYVERAPYFKNAKIVYNEKIHHLEMVENINSIAFKSLEQRMMEELGKSLLRVALKKAAEYQLRKKDQGLGAALGALNALSEKADTRNWQTVPHDISYVRVPLKAGSGNVKLVTEQNRKGVASREFNFTYNIYKGKTIFDSFNTIDSHY